MKSFLILLALITASLVVSSAVWAKTVYLKNGDEIECESYRQEGEKVFVRINPETEIDFAAEEIDPVKTPLQKPAVKKKTAKARRADATVAEPEGGDAGAASWPQTMDTALWFAGETPPSYRPGTRVLKKELSAVYEKFNQAALSGNFQETVKYMPKEVARRSLDSLAQVKDKQELLVRRKNMQETAVKKFFAYKCAISPDGKIAALAGTGMAMKGGKYQEANGTVRFVKEEDGWKVSFQIW